MNTAIRFFAIAPVLLGAIGCASARPNFSTSNYQPRPEAFTSVTDVRVKSVLHGLSPGLAMYDTRQEMLLHGAATLEPDGRDAFRINLRQEANPYRSACSYWFRVPIRPETWETGETEGAFGGFSVRFGNGEFLVEEGCGSPFSSQIPLVLTFKQPDQGKKFMNLMAALALG